MSAGFRIKYDEFCRRNCKERYILHPKLGSQLHSSMRGKRIGDPKMINYIMNKSGNPPPEEIEHGHYHQMASGVITDIGFNDGLSYTTGDYDNAEGLVDFAEFFADDRINPISNSAIDNIVDDFDNRRNRRLVVRAGATRRQHLAHQANRYANDVSDARAALRGGIDHILDAMDTFGVFRERPMQWLEESDSDLDNDEYEPAPDVGSTSQPLLSPIGHRTRSRVG